jgi:hypothetical protein
MKGGGESERGQGKREGEGKCAYLGDEHLNHVPEVDETVVRIYQPVTNGSG